MRVNEKRSQREFLFVGREARRRQTGKITEITEQAWILFSTHYRSPFICFLGTDIWARPRVKRAQRLVICYWNSRYPMNVIDIRRRCLLLILQFMFFNERNKCKSNGIPIRLLHRYNAHTIYNKHCHREDDNRWLLFKKNSFNKNITITSITIMFSEMQKCCKQLYDDEEVKRV